MQANVWSSEEIDIWFSWATEPDKPIVFVRVWELEMNIEWNVASTRATLYKINVVMYPEQYANEANTTFQHFSENEWSHTWCKLDIT